MNEESRPLKTKFVKKKKSSATQRKFAAIVVVGILNCLYSLAEVGFALYVDSMALLSDGIHNISDVISLIIAFWALYKSSTENTSVSMTYGWKRTEILGAVMNGCFLVSLCTYIVLEAVPKIIRNPTRLDSSWYFIGISAAGFVINTIGTILFSVISGGHGHVHAGGEKHGHAHKEKESTHEHDEENDHDHDHAHGHGKNKDKKDKEKKSKHDDHDNGEHDHGHGHGNGKKNKDKNDHAEHDLGEHGHGHGKKKKDKKDHEDGHDHGHGKKKNKDKHDHGDDHGDDHEHGHGHGKKKKEHDHEYGDESVDHKEQKKADHGRHGSINSYPHLDGEYIEQETPEDDRYFETIEESYDNKESEHKDHNMYAVFLHFLGDAFSSLLVLAAGLLSKYFPDEIWTLYLDPVCSLLIVLLILWTTLPLIFECSRILLQKAPAHIHIPSLKEKLLKIKGVRGIHDLHVWELIDSLYIASLHALVEDKNEKKTNFIIAKIKNVMHRNNIHSSTLQIEYLENNTDRSCKQFCVEECSEEWCCKDQDVDEVESYTF